ncbi:MAG: type III-A CRISPR-associated protein Cas10/Csm1 [Planctomycetes bacterium]|nr:type III-A CRISPR-associated protein Cas10/Csm1 [Planctomycetota bacterium]
MIVVGDISGIQNYLFDVAEAGGGQAQRLRARSFFVQLLAETAALRTLRALGWPCDSQHFLASSAGKFLLRGPDSSNIDVRLAREQQSINEWLARDTRAELRLTLASGESDSEVSAYNAAQQNLQRSKMRPWAPGPQCSWEVARLVLAPLDTPCSLCYHAPAQEEETDRDSGQLRRVCSTCAAQRRLGQHLPRAHWLVISDSPQGAEFDILGLGASVIEEEHVSIGQDALAVANLREPDLCPSWCPPQRFLKRRLMAHVPTDDGGQPVWFTELAQRARGDQLLAVLKADVDSLGVLLHQLMGLSGLDAVRGIGERLDAFFSGRLRQELANNRDGPWQWIYTVFAGGDDLVMVGPWNIMLDFAGQMRNWFAEEFHDQELTLSAGLALIKPKRPIKAAVAEAERLLEQAKTGSKDQLAGFGQVWKWQHHVTIMTTAKQLVEWEIRGETERGWLHTLLELAEARHGPTSDPLATARLTYHVGRNYRRNTESRKWAERLIERFDNREDIEVGYLPAIVRYALTATRAPGEKE